MFKSGEVAGIKGSPERRVTVLSNGNGPGWPVVTSGGTFDETDLFVVHPSVAPPEIENRSVEALVERVQREELEGARLPQQLRSRVEKIVPQIKFNWNGHWKKGSAVRKYFKEQLQKDVYLGKDALLASDAEDLVRAFDSGQTLDRWIPILVQDYQRGLGSCSCCGKKDLRFETNAKELRIVGEPCKFPKGLPHTEWEINVPSGKLVIANDLRELFPIPSKEDFDVNTSFGCRQTALAYAENGLGHAFIGNSSPGVYQCGDGTYKIANPPSDQDWNGKAWVKIKPKPKFDGKRVASICTDLWWFSICDYNEFKLRCKRFNLKPEQFGIEIVKVKSGVWRFRHDEGARNQETPGECVYTRFERVRKADPIKDLLVSYEAVVVHAHAYVQAQVKRWPGLYGKMSTWPKMERIPIPWEDLTEEDRNHAWQRVADQALCVIGSGIEWHERGFPRVKVDGSIPDIDPPSFRAQYHWYPFYESYGGLFEPATLSPSFAKLAFRVLESVISFGMSVHDGERCREVYDVRNRMLLAVKRYRELANQYPDLADPEYVTWLGQKDRAETWVENFDLGPEFTEKHRKYVSQQRWVPEDAYAIEFDARKLKGGSFAWHPKKGGCWANKKVAQRYALLQWVDNNQPGENNCCWLSHATNTSVPLYSVARVVRVGEVSHMGETLVELAFDYGTPWMQDSTKRKALSEKSEKDGIHVLSKDEYEKLLSKAIHFYDEAETKVK